MSQQQGPFLWPWYVVSNKWFSLLFFFNNWFHFALKMEQLKLPPLELSSQVKFSQLGYSEKHSPTHTCKPHQNTSLPNSCRSSLWHVLHFSWSVQWMNHRVFCFCLPLGQRLNFLEITTAAWWANRQTIYISLYIISLVCPVVVVLSIHPSSSSRKKKMMEEEEEEDEWQQFLQMFMWSNPVVYEKLL